MKQLLYAALCATLFITGCGGSDDGPAETPQPLPGQPAALTATITPAGALASSASIEVRFSAAVETSTLAMTGSFVALGPVPEWSSAGDVLTLKPPVGGWPRGRGGELSVNAKGKAGGSLAAPVTATYLVPLQVASGQAALGAIGQTGLGASNSQTANGRSARTILSAVGAVAVAPDGRLFVGDSSNHRILGFPAIPSSSDAAADIVLGQADFATAAAGVARDKLTRPQQVSIAGGRMAVTDFSNNRVLIWAAVPSASGALPDVVLGQADFTTGTGACGAGSLNFPETVVLTPNGKVIVADTENNRVLVWNSVPAANGAAPDLILGQSAPSRCTGNDDDQNGVRDAAPSARTLRRPTGLWSDGEKLVVVDSTNHRVLVWNAFPTSSFQPASIVLGQSDFAHFTRNDDDQNGTADAAPTARTLFDPWSGVGSNGVQLAVADSGNNRVLVWNTFPTTNFQPADAVLGQATFDASAAATTATGMNYPAGVVFHQDKILVTDRFNNRVLVLQSP